MMIIIKTEEEYKRMAFNNQIIFCGTPSIVLPQDALVVNSAKVAKRVTKLKPCSSYLTDIIVSTDIYNVLESFTSAMIIQNRFYPGTQALRWDQFMRSQLEKIRSLRSIQNLHAGRPEERELHLELIALICAVTDNEVGLEKRMDIIEGYIHSGSIPRTYRLQARLDRLEYLSTPGLNPSEYHDVNYSSLINKVICRKTAHVQTNYRQKPGWRTETKIHMGFLKASSQKRIVEGIKKLSASDANNSEVIYQIIEKHSR